MRGIFQNHRRTAVAAGIILCGVCCSIADATTILGAVFDRSQSGNAEVRALFEQAICDTASSAQTVRLASDKCIEATGDAASVNQALDRLLADSSVKMILALGPLTSLEACRRTTLSKPVIAVFMVDPAWAGLPSGKEGSGRKNLAYSSVRAG